jgi:cell division protein FtsI/penicillin-binding protein 2
VRAARARGIRTATAALAAVAVLAAGLTACSPKPPTPDAEAAALATALATGSFADVVLAPGAPSPDALAAARDAALKGLGAAAPKVTVAAVAVDPKDATHATANLHWTWDLGTSQPWSYDVTAQLQLGEAGKGQAWQAQWRPSLLAPDLVDGEKLSVQRQAAQRGTVLGGGGAVIVEPRPVWRVGIDKTHVDAAGQDASARALATALHMDPAAYAAQVAAAGPQAFVEAITVRQNDPAYDVPTLAKIAGVNAVAGQLALAPTRQFARPILGQVGQATKEIIDGSGGAIVAGDLTGTSGLQRQYDDQLRGAPGLTVVAVNGPVTRRLFHVDPVAGTPLQTTFDVTLQEAAERILAPVPGSSALVAIRPSTGEVLVAASGPNGDGLSTATVGQYAPGSTFKVASALALLRAGMTPASTLTCPTSVVVDGYTFRNVPGYPAAAMGTIPLTTAFAHSCNTAFVGQAATVSQDALIGAARSLGLDPAPSLGFPAFLAGVPADSRGTDHAASLIGQGRVIASPLGMATVAASVAAGHTVTPVLVKPAPGTRASDETPAPVATATEPATPAAPLTQAEADTLRGLMRGVVTGGTATLLKDVPAPEVAAKTGTAEFQTANGLANHAWLIAIHGDLAVAAFVETGDFGATTAGPLMDAFLTAAG